MEKFKNQDKKCYICNDEIELFKEDIVASPCGHIFHFDCLYHTFVGNKQNINKNNHNTRECPYCRYQIKSYLPEYKLELYPKKTYIHTGYISTGNYYSYYIKKKPILCSALLKSGKRKGQLCNCKTGHWESDSNTNNEVKYCGRHKNYKQPIVKEVKDIKEADDNVNTTIPIEIKEEFKLIQL
jgi:hypothetical protein